MGVYIKSMKMPKGCGECNIPCGIRGLDKILFGFDETRPKSCPLVEVPEPHGRLIDADEIPVHREGYDYVAYLDSIAEMPTVIEAEDE